MKEIPNKITALPNKLGGFLTFVDLLKVALDFPPTNGFDPHCLRSRARVDSALVGVKDGGTIKLEDADYATAQAAIQSVRWASRQPDYIYLADAFGI